MKNYILIIIAVLQFQISKAENLAEIHSPNNDISCYISSDNAKIYGVVNLNKINTKIIRLNIGMSTSDCDFGLQTDKLVSIEKYEYRDKITSSISEIKSQEDNYNLIVMNMQNSFYDYEIHIRAYNEGIAVRYKIKSEKQLSIVKDFTGIDLTNYNPTSYCESHNESGYSKRGSGASTISMAPLFITCDKFCVLMNEANNRARTEKASIKINNGLFTYMQTYNSAKEITTSWRYIIFSDKPQNMIKAKYIVHSLNEKPNEDFSWIKPGKTFRSTCEDNVFYTDTVKKAIDFAKKMNFSYVLLDAGWYGLGYSKEHNSRSNPMEPVSTLDIEEVVKYGNENEIGIILYVNKVAWENFNNEAMLNLYNSWGIKGLKLGFMDGNSQKGMDQIYRIIEGAAKRKMIVNVHDDFRQTGIERNLVNLVSTEGIKGNEHRENDGWHTTLLPFIRFMTGSADYTICYRGYPINKAAYQNMPTTKGHQLALSTIYFCPIQHIFWYGKHFEYPIKTEIEYFEKVPTVWDDYEILEGEPTNYFTIARKKDEKYFLATITNSERTAIINFNFLPIDKTYRITIYEDCQENSIIKNTIENINFKSRLDLNLMKNGGAVAILEETGDNFDQEPEIPEEDAEETPNENEDDSNENEDENDEYTAIETIDNQIFKLETTLKLFPNPATTTIEIDKEMQNEKFLIFNMSGRLIEKVELSGRPIIDISNLKPGVYIITNGKISAKFIKQ